ncbi:dehydrodolichyl diphosphate synthase complex subunit nus1 [Anaeramoeba flamelloides]|uniref:ditrans,polycis-polyprenyl diphosphate synthase [(2E,6E)-farnesyldiphosphate specific] n=1 Tax=Anaeramoeba flamelloides TaxID=1746091 RepID=A0AAV8AI60_9EUKA|nr:dehydrodolichyl diphosphate synthase complex subunit nus1 [Anaeramoeba flamelloides]
MSIIKKETTNFRNFVFSFFTKYKDFTTVSNQVSDFQKKPKHLAFLFDGDKIENQRSAISKLADLLVWSYSAQIPYITLFDRDGKIKNYKAQLEKEFKTKINNIKKKEHQNNKSKPTTPFNSDSNFRILSNIKMEDFKKEKEKYLQILIQSKDEKLQFKEVIKITENSKSIKKVNSKNKQVEIEDQLSSGKVKEKKIKEEENKNEEQNEKEVEIENEIEIKEEAKEEEKEKEKKKEEEEEEEKKEKEEKEKEKKQEIFKINLASEEQGKEQIVEITKWIDSLIQENEITKTSIHENSINNIYQEIIQTPDPELLIKFGADSKLTEFMPWQIRLTEFFFAGKFNSFSYYCFIESLKKFANIQKRFGK